MERSEQESPEPEGQEAGPTPAAPSPSAARPARRHSRSEKVRDAERAFALLVEWMNDSNNPLAFRRSCAHDVMDHVWGKTKEPTPSTPDTTVKDVSQLSDEERAASVAAILEHARARANRRTDRGTKPGRSAP